MKRNIAKKISIILLISFAFSILIVSNNVKAITSDQSELNDILKISGKIMKYDIKTNETTEVNMEELKQVISVQSNENNGLVTISGFNNTCPAENLTKNVFVPFSSSTSVNRITDTSQFPYRATCRITAMTDSGEDRYGTVSIFGPKVALTSAHCIFDDKNGKAILKNWTIYPGFNNGSYYGTPTGWTQVYYSNDWMNNNKDYADWAVCLLES